MTFGNIAASTWDIHWILPFWTVFASSFICAVIATWLCRKIALKFGIVDRPDGAVKTHKEPTAYLGGVGMFAGLAIGVVAGIYSARNLTNYSSITVSLVGILFGGAIACLVGVLDDISDLKPKLKIIGQLVAAVVLALFGARPALGLLTSPLGWEISTNVEMILALPVVIFFVLGATNSLNLLDGIDGLCAGVSAVMALGMIVLAMLVESQSNADVSNPVRLIIALALLGSVCGFFPFNKNPAKIFMGDTGSLLLGFTFAAMMILFAAVGPKWCLSSIVIFGLPILDTSVAFARRLLNKRPIFVSDRGHIYDQMMDRGLSVKKTVALCCGLAAMYALIGLLGSQIRTGYALIVYVVAFGISAMVVWARGYLKMQGLRGAAGDQ